MMIKYRSPTVLENLGTEKNILQVIFGTEGPCICWQIWEVLEKSFHFTASSEWRSWQ